jgi:hypothetical protein
LIINLSKGGTVQMFGNNPNGSNSVQEEFKSRLKAGNAYYHSKQNLLSSSLLSKNIKLKTGLYRTIILPVAYGCETWSLTLREKRRLRVFENRVLRRIFGPERDEGIGEWRQLHNEELYDLYSPPNIIWVIKSRTMSWAGHVAHMVERRALYRILEGRSEGKRHLEGLDVDERMILKGIFKKLVVLHGLDCSGCGQGQVAGSCECGNGPLSSRQCEEVLTG